MKNSLLIAILAFGILAVPALSQTQQTAAADSTTCGKLEYGGVVYPTVIIGEQCWMAQNLNAGKWLDQSQIQRQTDNNVLEKYCYGNDFTMCDLWGGLYQWDEMMMYSSQPGGKGICPEGWHIPTSQEWNQMVKFLGGDKLAGGKLKYTGATSWHTPNVGATNSSGFTAQPGGYLDYMAQRWHDEYAAAYFWTSTPVNKGTAAAFYLTSRTSMTDIYEEYCPSGLSVRCVRDK
jgi:uncharacterized protein (TIGR02145 family)